MGAITAEGYVALDRTRDVDGLQKELERVINAQPTQIGPPDREALLSAILDDLEDKENAPWTQWPTPMYLLSLTALKSLGRNPVGSTVIIERLRLILHHTSLGPTPASRPPNDPEHPTSLEALKALANALVLHDAARRKFAEMGGGKAISKALNDVHPSAERLFLLGRVGFLVTMDRREVVREAVDKEGLVDSLVLHLSSTSVMNPTLTSNSAALTELLKLTNNVVRFYPTSENGWSSVLTPLLAPVLALLHTIPTDDLASPLTNTIHVLLSIPFSTELIALWTQIPPPPPRQISPSSTLDKFSSLIIGQAPRISMDSIRDSISLSDRSASTSGGGNAKRRSPTPPRTDEPTALPARLVRILETFFSVHLPPGRSVDEERRDGIALDEILPPLLLLLSRAATGIAEVKTYLKAKLLPSTLDRSASAGPLEKRPGVLGTLLRLMHGAAHTQSRDTSGELLWVICDSDPATLSREIGYGNAAGLLFRKGLSGPPEARIEELPNEEDDARNPITSIHHSDSTDDPSAGMTQEEKEREAERLFVLFDRMERNPVISASTSAKDVMRDKLEKGQLEDDEAEEREKEEREMRDEEEAMADLRRYKERAGKRWT